MNFAPVFSSIIRFVKGLTKLDPDCEAATIEALEAVILLNPFLFEAYVMLKEIYLRKGHKEPCIQLLEKLVLLNPRDNLNALVLRKLQVEKFNWRKRKDAKR